MQEENEMVEFLTRPNNAMLLQIAARKNKLADIKKLLDQGYTNIIGENGETPLGIACSCGYLSIIREFLARRCKPDMDEINYFCLGAKEVAIKDKILILTKMLISFMNIDITTLTDVIKTEIIFLSVKCLQNSENISMIMWEHSSQMREWYAIANPLKLSDSSEGLEKETGMDLTGNVDY